MIFNDEAWIQAGRLHQTFVVEKLVLEQVFLGVSLFKFQMGFLPVGSDTTIRHNTQITHQTK
jgi:hypothetical protein